MNLYFLYIQFNTMVSSLAEIVQHAANAGQAAARAQAGGRPRLELGQRRHGARQLRARAAPHPRAELLGVLAAHQRLLLRRAHLPHHDGGRGTCGRGGGGTLTQVSIIINSKHYRGINERDFKTVIVL